MNLKQHSDEQLLTLFAGGNHTAFETLMHRHKQRVYTAIYVFVKDRYIAEDIFQDTFCKVVEYVRQKRYNEQGKFLPWVMRIAHNACIDFYRRHKRAPIAQMPESFDIYRVVRTDDTRAEKTMIREEQHDLVRKLVAQLPDEQREVLMLRHYGELSFKEIADKTGVSINTALGRMRYALINLRKMMETAEAIEMAGVEMA
jgi:RNA polymerase sigma-70 factor (ECF subfamily)